MEASGQAAIELAGDDLESKFAALEGEDELEPGETAQFTITYDPVTYEFNQNEVIVFSNEAISFFTNHKKVELPNWLKQKYPEEMTILIQYEYYDLKINKNNFSISLSFNDIKTNLIIDYNSIISFADPSANFGLILQKNKIQKNKNKKLDNKKQKKDNVINFSNFKKN